MQTKTSVREAQQLIHTQREQGWIELVERYGQTFVYQGNLATCDPKLIQTLLMSRVHCAHRSKLYEAAARWVPGAPGLLFLDGEAWMQHLRAAMPVLTPAQIANASQTIFETVVDYLRRWHDGQRLSDLYVAMTELGVGVALRVGYGLDPNEALANAFGEALMAYKLRTMSTRSPLPEFGFSHRQLIPTFHFVGEHFILRRYMATLRQCLQTIMDARAVKYQPSWITLFCEAGLPFEATVDALNHIYGAFNAIDYTLACALYELSRHPQWVGLLRSEQETVLGSRAFPTPQDFPALPQMMAFMKEIFRHYPVAAAVARRTGAPISVEGKDFPAGQETLILVTAVHHHPDYWDDPFTFDPTRWFDAPEGRVPYSYIPFLTGPRHCIGRHLAELHFVITLSTMLKLWRVEALDHSVRVNHFLIPRFERSIPAIIHSAR